MLMHPMVFSSHVTPLVTRSSLHQVLSGVANSVTRLPLWHSALPQTATPQYDALPM